MYVHSGLLRTSVLVLAIVVPLGVALPRGYGPPKPAAARGSTLYDPDPRHLWNRLHDALRARLTTEQGVRVNDREEFLLEPEESASDANELDPMLGRLTWHFSNYLLTGPEKERHEAMIRQRPELGKYPPRKREAHRDALAVLDEFLAQEGEKLIRDPLRRALLQRDLWALFDSFADPIWSHWWPGRPDPSPSEYPRERRALQTRLAKILPRLALSREQIRRLPDTYADTVKAGVIPGEFDPRHKGAAFLPRDLWQPDGPWVLLGEAGDQTLAEVHTRFFGGRSVFLAFLNLPGGRPQTLEYIKRLKENARPDDDPQKRVKGAPLPQFPPRTQVALVRRTLLLDDRGDIIPSRLTETVQVRVYLDPRRQIVGDAAADVQTFLEHRLRRRDLLAGKLGALSPVEAPERERFELLTFGRNLESGRQPILASCSSCHSAPGIESVNSYMGPFRSGRGKASLTEMTVAEEGRLAANWKKTQYTWGLLEGMWAKPLQKD